MPDFKLSNCSSLKNLHHLLVKDHPKFQVEIGCFGGRKYTLVQGNEKQTFRLNDLVKYLKNVSKDPKNEEDSFYVYNISKIVGRLDIQGTETLDKKNLFLRILTAVKQWWGNRGFSRDKELEIIRKDFSVPNFYTNKSSQHPLNESQKIITDFFTQSPIRAGFYDVLYEVANLKTINSENIYEQLQNYVFKKWNHPHIKNEKEMINYLSQNPSEEKAIINDFESVIDTNLFAFQAYQDDSIREKSLEAFKNLSKMDLSIVFDEMTKKDEKSSIASFLTYLILVNNKEDLFFKFFKEDYVWPNEQIKDLVNFYTQENNLKLLIHSIQAWISRIMKLAS